MAGIGAAYGTAKAGVGVASIAINRPELIMKSIIPVIMAGMVGIYGLIIAVFLSTNSTPCLALRSASFRPFELRRPPCASFALTTRLFGGAVSLLVESLLDG